MSHRPKSKSYYYYFLEKLQDDILDTLGVSFCFFHTGHTHTRDTQEKRNLSELIHHKYSH